MQKKHLQLFLLFLLGCGCQGQKFPDRNPYLFQDNKFELNIESETPAVLLNNGLDLRGRNSAVPVWQLKIDGSCENSWEFSLLDDRGEPLILSHPNTSRSLFSLSLEDSSAHLKFLGIPLPNGLGVTFFVEGEPSRIFRVAITPPTGCIPSETPPQKLSDRILQWVAQDGHIFLLASRDALTAVPMETVPLIITLKPHRLRHILFCTGRNVSEARQTIESWGKLSPEKLEDRIYSERRKHFAFDLSTEDERTNQAVVLLLMALDHSQNYDPKIQPEVTAAAQLSAARWLVSRASPQWIFANNNAAGTDSLLWWGESAFRAVMSYGMVREDTLKTLSLKILESLASLQRNYTLSALGSFSVYNIALDRAEAEIHAASLFMLGESLCQLRGDLEGQSTFHSLALKAGKRGRSRFREISQQYQAKNAPAHESLTHFFDKTGREDPDKEFPELDSAQTVFPDSGRWLETGARYGFNWLGENVTALWGARCPRSGFVWQKWVAFKFCDQTKIVETPDYDSLVTMLLEGAVPGVLTVNPGHLGEPSPEVMGTALENLVEIYLGVRGNWIAHRIDIEPHLPALWGYTTARVPLGTGYVYVEFDLAGRKAKVSLQEITPEQDVYFGYPLPAGGFIRTQFKLSRRYPQATIRMEREKDNRVRLFVDGGE